MKKILIADDQPDSVRVLKAKLETIGYEVVSAINGKEALKKTYELKPDLLILDICMPLMEGTEVAIKIKQDAQAKQAPVIFLTGLKKKDEEEKLGAESAGHFIFSKPLDVGMIVEKICQLLGD